MKSIIIITLAALYLAPNAVGQSANFAAPKPIGPSLGTIYIFEGYLLTADVDFDGDIDFYHNSFDGKTLTTLYENLGGCSFSPPQKIFDKLPEHKKYSTTPILGQDIDGDGDGDAYISGLGWLENMDGSNFSHKSFSPIQLLFEDLLLPNWNQFVDIDGDGDADIVMIDRGRRFTEILHEEHWIDGKLVWYKNLGGGDFSRYILIDKISENVGSVRFADYDKDGDVDVLFYEDGWYIYKNYGVDYFSAKQTADAPFEYNDYRCVDVDLDGVNEYFTFTGDRLTFHKYNPNSGYFWWKKLECGEDGHKLGGVVDVSGDGYPDVVMSATSGRVGRNLDQIVIFYNDGTGEFGEPIILNDSLERIVSIVLEDFDNDGDIDIISHDAGLTTDSGKIGGLIQLYENLSAPTAAESEDLSAPEIFGLEQNYPNPFNPATAIRYALPEAATVRLTVFNALGQVVRELESSAKQAGYHETSFNASDLGSGVYFYRIDAVGSSGERFQETRKMLLVK